MKAGPIYSSVFRSIAPDISTMDTSVNLEHLGWLLHTLASDCGVSAPLWVIVAGESAADGPSR